MTNDWIVWTQILHWKPGGRWKQGRRRQSWQSDINEETRNTDRKKCLKYMFYTDIQVTY